LAKNWEKISLCAELVQQMPDYLHLSYGFPL
jgi:hypothetical protein